VSRPYPTLVILAIACLLASQAQAGQKLRVFFIGNSYTHTNDLPKMIADVAASLGDTLVYDEHSPGGYRFVDHWSNTPVDPCVASIKKGAWDYVVLQEQSQWPAFSENGFFISTYMYGELFNKLMRDSAKCSMPMFYMTWGYKNGDAANCASFPHMCTYGSMDSILRVRYMQMADSFDAVVSPVGAVRRYIRQNYPGIELYQPDGSHPEVAGTYAAACCFYTALFKRDPSLINFNSTLSAAEALDIRAAAKAVVYDSMARWGLGVYDLSAAFSHSISGTTVTFTGKSSLKAQSYHWDFGDGTSSSLKDPVHTYASKGSYTVSLIAYSVNGCSRLVTDKVSLLTSGVSSFENASFIITPSPVKSTVSLKSLGQVKEYTVRIGDAVRDVVYVEDVKGDDVHTIDLSALSSGVYFIALYNTSAVLYRGKVVKE
jgi:hypothetical protein